MGLESWKQGGGMENPRAAYVAPARHRPATHVTRARQLPTKSNPAARLGSGLATREYQSDSPSIFALLPELQFIRDEPRTDIHIRRLLDRLVHIRRRGRLVRPRRPIRRCAANGR